MNGFRIHFFASQASVHSIRGAKIISSVASAASVHLERSGRFPFFFMFVERRLGSREGGLSPASVASTYICGMEDYCLASAVTIHVFSSRFAPQALISSAVRRLFIVLQVQRAFISSLLASLDEHPFLPLVPNPPPPPTPPPDHARRSRWCWKRSNSINRPCRAYPCRARGEPRRTYNP